MRAAACASWLSRSLLDCPAPSSTARARSAAGSPPAPPGCGPRRATSTACCSLMPAISRAHDARRSTISARDASAFRSQAAMTVSARTIASHAAERRIVATRDLLISKRAWSRFNNQVFSAAAADRALSLAQDARNIDVELAGDETHDGRKIVLRNLQAFGNRGANVREHGLPGLP